MHTNLDFDIEIPDEERLILSGVRGLGLRFQGLGLGFCLLPCRGASIRFLLRVQDLGPSGHEVEGLSEGLWLP